MGNEPYRSNLKKKKHKRFQTRSHKKQTISEILEIAGRALSAMNTQPWEFIVITGSVLNNIRREIVKKLNNGDQIHPEHSVGEWPSDSVYRHHQVELAKQIFKLMEIPREDKANRAKWLERGFRFFDAPAAIIITTDRSLSESGPLLDIGAVM